MFHLRPHLFHLALGLVALVLASRFDYHRLADRPILFGLVGSALVLLVWVLVLNIERKGAVRWIQLAGFSFQPSEFAKLVLVVWLAVRLTESGDQIRTFHRGFLPPMGIVALFMILILAERDLGAPVVIGATGLLMCLVAGVRWPFIAGTAATGVGCVYALCRTTGYRWQRIVAWLDPWEHPDTPQGYQLIQSLGAFARGGFWGKGPGGSQQKLFYLPEAKNDFIFAICGEEMGLAGTLLVVILVCPVSYHGDSGRRVRAGSAWRVVGGRRRGADQFPGPMEHRHDHRPVPDERPASALHQCGRQRAHRQPGARRDVGQRRTPGEATGETRPRFGRAITPATGKGNRPCAS